MSRAAVAGLASPHPLGERLPALYLEDPFAQGMMAALDEVLAPIFSVVDNLEWYFDPRLAPPDFLEWLGTWVGLVLDESWPLERRREFVAAASRLYRIRGTQRGLAAHLAIVTGLRVELSESGGTSWSTSSGTPAPGRPGFELTVRLYAEDPSRVNLAAVHALVSAAKPAHVVHRVEVVPA